MAGNFYNVTNAGPPASPNATGTGTGNGAATGTGTGTGTGVGPGQTVDIGAAGMGARPVGVLTGLVAVGMVVLWL